MLLWLTVCILIDAKGSPSLYLCNQLQHLNGKKIIIIMNATFAVAKRSDVLINYKSAQ